ncbi:MAG: class I SAM-dependent methyltransferase [Magnetospirillum sp. WYHS-4]
MSIETSTIACPICSSATTFLFRPLYTPRQPQWARRVAHVPGDQRNAEAYFHCDNCGYVYRPEGLETVAVVSAAEPEGSAAEKADAAICPVAPAGTISTPELEAGFRRRGEQRELPPYPQRYDWVAAHAAKGRFLDVGCEYGYLGAALRDRGFDAIGIDPGADAANIGCQRLGIPIEIGLYTADAFPPESFDTVAAEGVAYYFRPSLRAFLDIAKGHLRPGGVVYMQLPGVTGTGDAFFQNFVRCLVPYEAVDSVFAHAGWEIVAKTDEWFQNGSYGIIARPSDKVLNTPAKADRQRILGDLICSDYGLLRNRGPVPGWARAIQLLLHGLAPGGALPGYFARGLNRLWPAKAG